MLTTSTAPAYKASLLAAMQADPALVAANAQVASTFPGDTLRPIAVYFGKTTAAVTTPVMASSARIKRNEQYVVELHIDVTAGTTDFTQAENTAFGVMGEIDNILANNPLQNINDGNNTFVWNSHVINWNSRPYFDETRQGWAVLLTVQIQVEARLR